MKPKRDKKLGIWCFKNIPDYYRTFCYKEVTLPFDADEKLIGKHLSWKDEPVEI